MPRDASYEELFFEWMCRKVCTEDEIDTYSALLMMLTQIPFEVSPLAPRDEARLEDGRDLKYHFANDLCIPDRVVAYSIPVNPSVLEVLVALAVRGELQMMSDIERYGDRTSLWFWTMLHNIGVTQFTNRNFNPEGVRYQIDKFLQRTYDRDGRNGGAFVVDYPPGDMRTTELWYQMSWYFNTVD